MSPDRVVQEAPWLLWLLEAMQRGQEGLLRLWHALGWTPVVDGQPAWPWAQRLAGEHLLLDVGQARALAGGLVAAALVVVLLLLAWLSGRRRRLRWGLLASAGLVAVLAPWPSAQVLWVPASPRSFHHNPVPFSDTAIAAGAGHYQRLCVACHGTTGDGQGPLAARQAVWPPSFIGPLLWRRADGDLLHAVRQGVTTAGGQPSMPGFAEQLTVAQSWELLHFLRAQAAGQLLQLSGSWAMPVALPDMALRCPGQPWQRVRDLQRQRVRLVGLEDVQGLLPDPRMLTLWLPPEGRAVAATLPAAVDCVVTSGPEARQALRWLTGSEALQQTQLLADKSGWLRARNDRGADSWSEGDLVCRLADAGAAVPASTAEDSLTRLLRSMDSQPVVYVKGGSLHGGAGRRGAPRDQAAS